jgi:hypothetical protein
VCTHAAARAGTPEKRLAVLPPEQRVPEQQAAQARRLQPQSDPPQWAGRAAPGRLGHRERLQAGIQELNGKFYGSIRAAW